MDFNKEKGDFDIILLIEELQLPCYKDVLCQNSLYFEAMFNSNFAEKDKDIVEIHDVNPTAMTSILKWCQHKQIQFEEFSKIKQILQISRMLQFHDLEAICANEISSKWMNINKCLDIMFLTDSLQIIDLFKKSKSMSLWEFDKIKCTEEFLQLTFQFLYNYLKEDGLNINLEFDILEALLLWIQHDYLNREPYFFELFKLIRFKDIQLSEIQTMLLYPEINQNEEIKTLVLCIRDFKENCQFNSDQMEFINKFDIEDLNNYLSSDCNVCDGICTTQKYTCTYLIIANNLLNKHSRSLPLSPCFVGDFQKIPSFIWLKNSSLPPSLITHIPPNDKNNFPMGSKAINIGFDIYFSGGEYSLGYHDWNATIWKYNIWDNKWCIETNLNHPRRHHSLAVFNNDIYFIGGVNTHRVTMRSFEKYNIISKEWTECAPLPICIYSAAACVFQGRIFVIGHVIYFYKPNINTWFMNESGPSSLPIGANSAMTDNKYIYFTGLYSKKLYRFHPDDSKTFDFLGEFHQNASNSCLIYNKIYAITSDDSNLEIEVFDLETKQFSIIWSKSSSRSSKDAITRINAEHSIGCFPIVDYC